MSYVPFRRAAVIGAGVMGAGIAAHLANAGLEVLLLDIASPGGKGDRNRFAQNGVKNALEAKPLPAFYHPSRARLVRTGNTEDDLGKVASCDLVIEAIIEKLEAKQELFARLETVIGDGAIVASNTSGLRISEMTQGRSVGFKKRFLVMHFFNPVRNMKLLELVCGPETSPDTLARVRRFGEDVLGKGIVIGKDTPNFVGNRIGAHAMMVTIHQMLADELTPEDVDAITGLPMAHPKSASFRTADIVGLDTFVHVADHCHASLTSDEEREVFVVPEFVREMLGKKLLGDKTKGGFYRKVAGDIETFDPYTRQYRKKSGDAAIKEMTKALSKESDPKQRLRKLVADPGKAGRFAWKVLSRSLAYAARRIPEIADDVVSIDDAMRWGYNWELGPFEAWDALGFVPTLERMQKDGIALPPWIEKMRSTGADAFYKDGEVFDPKRGAYVERRIDPRSVTFDVMKRTSAPVVKNAGAEAWDLGDGVLGLRFRSHANTIDADVIAMLHMSLERAERDFRAMVIANEGEHFCPGANVFLIAAAASQKQWDQIREMVQSIQTAMQRIKYATIPVVAAPFNATMGGGLELCLASAEVQASAETYAGLVEVGVGLIPGGAGNMNLLWRALEGIPEGAAVNTLEIVVQVFKNIALAKVALSAEAAKHAGYFRKTDGVSFDRARLLTEAKARALGLAESGWHPPAPRAFVLPGESGVATLKMMVTTLVQGGYATEHDAKIAGKLAEVLCGGKSGASHEVTEDEMLELEREAFLSLCGEQKSLERMQHFAMTQKPLRN
jgi:3-hydroxyacyl-CoA dehydrogenase